MKGPPPPRFWRWLLERSLPAELRAGVSGDLEEVYRRTEAESGARAARGWYRREALSFVLRFTADSVGRRLRSVLPGTSSRTRRTFVSWLDFKLGLRMLVRYPGLTVVGGLAMAFAIWLGAGAFEIVSQVVNPTVPLPNGDRIVGIRQWDALASEPESRVAHDFVRWRSELQAVTDVGAFRTVDRNLVVAGATGEVVGAPVSVAEITASAFRVAAVPPLLGRTLLEADEAHDAPAVVLIGHDLWQSRFGGALGAVGHVVRVGGVDATVIGVMPSGFAFPVSHGAWMPLRADVLEHGPRDGPSLQVFGRLADGATLATAQAEVTAAARRAAAASPDTHTHLRPSVVPYPRLILDVPRAESIVLASTNVFLLMLLVLICGNVGLLMFARAATRESELVVRSALGASRSRIVMQLFAEALVLGTVAAVIGLAAAGAGVRWALGVAEAEAGMPLPFWFHGSLSLPTIGYALLLTLLCAVVAGVTPALRITRSLQSRLRETAAQGGGLRFSGVWTVVIVCQVAVTVAFPATIYVVWRDLHRVRTVQIAFDTTPFLVARLGVDDATGTAAAADGRWRDLEQRLLADPAVESVTFAERLPRMYHPHRLIEIDAGDAAPLRPEWPGYRISSTGVDAGYFDAVGVAPLAGRGFTAADAEHGRDVVVVNRSFVHNVLGGRNPVGRRLRYTYFEESGPQEPDDAPWYEIVGVVADMGMFWGTNDPKAAGVYHVRTPGTLQPLHVVVRVRGEPTSFSPQLRRVAAAVDPALRVEEPRPLDHLNHGEIRFLQFWLRLTLLVSAVALILSLAGIYAVMSFTVARRTREIGIRVALGADARRLLLGVLRRPLAQVGAGLLTGSVLAALLLAAATSQPSARMGAGFGLYAVLMVAVCALGCALPVRRALRVPPTEALRADT